MKTSICILTEGVASLTLTRTRQSVRELAYRGRTNETQVVILKKKPVTNLQVFLVNSWIQQY